MACSTPSTETTDPSGSIFLENMSRSRGTKSLGAESQSADREAACTCVHRNADNRNNTSKHILLQDLKAQVFEMIID